MKKTPSKTLQPKSLRQASILGPTHPRGLALGISAAIMSSMSLAAPDQTEDREKQATELSTVIVEGRPETNPYAQPGSPYKAMISGDSRRVTPLAETPQTITVMTKEMIQDSGVTDLREMLDAQPGITLGTGENGNAFGDRYIIRGQEARSDVFVDSLRDPGMTIRESFATEQVEITKGPSSTFAGRGSSGGAVNSISKMASLVQDFSQAQAGVGTDQYHRLTLDSNQTIGENIALRVNLMEAYEEVPDRDPADRARAGVALSGLVKANDKLVLSGDYYFLDAKDMPDLGTYIEPNGGDPVDDIPVYAQKEDFLNSEVEVFTLKQNYDFNDTVRLQNALRYGTTDNGYVATGARGNTRHTSDPTAPRQPTISLSTHQGWQEVEYFVDQLNLYLDTELANMNHQLILGAEFSDLKVLNGVYYVKNTEPTNCRLGTSGAGQNGYCIVNEHQTPYRNLSEIMGRRIDKGKFDSDYQVETLSLYTMDTIDLTDKWMLSLGVRLDDLDYSNTVATGAQLNNFTDYGYSDKLWNYQGGLTYKINQQGNVYFNYSTSKDVNGGESDLGANCGYGGICGSDNKQVGNSKPESVENMELGTKWNILDEKLLLTAAAFRVTKDDVMESVGNAYSTLGTLNTGKNRVDGYEVSVTGNLTPDLSLQLGAATMESGVLKSFQEETEGRVLSNFADDSLFLQLRYQATQAFAFGGTARYSSEMYTGQPDSAAGWNATLNEYAYEVPAYTVYDLFASYQLSKQASLMLNIGNVMDTDYYLAGYRSGAFTYKGDERSAKLTLTYDF